MSPIEPPSHPFRRCDLEKQGIARRQLRRWQASGAVRRLLHDVYVSGEVEDSVELRLAAAALAIAPGHIACDRTAAWLLGVDTLVLGEAATTAPEVCVLRGEFPSERPQLRSHTRDLAPHDVVESSGIRITSPLRTALDLGCNLLRPDALAAIDQLRKLYAIGTEDLHREAVRFRGRRGVVQLRGLIGLSDPGADSPAESWTRLVILDAGLPAPVLQWEVFLEGVTSFIDMAYPDRKIAVEYDGREFHSSAEQRENDRTRRARLRRAGWLVIVVRIEDLYPEGCRSWLRDLKEALVRRPRNLRW